MIKTKIKTLAILLSVMVLAIPTALANGSQFQISSEKTEVVSGESFEGADDVERPPKSDEKEPVTNEDIGPVGGDVKE